MTTIVRLGLLASSFGIRSRPLDRPGGDREKPSRKAVEPMRVSAFHGRHCAHLTTCLFETQRKCRANIFLVIDDEDAELRSGLPGVTDSVAITLI